MLSACGMASGRSSGGGPGKKRALRLVARQAGLGQQGARLAFVILDQTAKEMLGLNFAVGLLLGPGGGTGQGTEQTGCRFVTHGSILVERPRPVNTAPK